MHLLLIGIVVGALLVWLLTRTPSPAAPQPAAQAGGFDAAPAGPHRLAFVARGKLFYSEAGGTPREIHSPHVQGVMDRMERSRQLHGWKQDTTFGVRAYGRTGRGPGTELAIRATSAQFASDGRLLYFLRDESMGGLFEQDLASGTEKRLLHRQNLLLDDLQLDAGGRTLVCTQQSKNGTACIVTLDREGNGYRELTGGDTVDTAPCWVAGKPNLVVFQSTGLARDPNGYVVAQGPATIQLLDMSDGTLTTVLDDARYDHLQPRVGADGSLLFIRRPYERPRYGGGNMLIDALLFPFRLARAVFHYLNFFSLMYTRKPLTSADGPHVEADLKEILLQGRRIDAEAALRRGDRVYGVPSLVPSTWQLIARNERGDERLLATHVASFDVAHDGTVLYSNGYGVFALGEDGRSRIVLKDKLIAAVVAG